MVVVITIPHYCIFPPPPLWQKVHYCDFLAGKAASCLKGKRFFGDITRWKVDLNRIQSRKTPYRRKLRRYVRKNKDRVKFVVDVHSFPPEDERYGPWEVVILDDSKASIPKYTQNFKKYLSDRGVKITIIRGDKNDIHVEMRKLGFASFLLEFNEGLKQERLKKICSIINDWLKTFDKNEIS